MARRQAEIFQSDIYGSTKYTCKWTTALGMDQRSNSAVSFVLISHNKMIISLPYRTHTGRNGDYYEN